MVRHERPAESCDQLLQSSCRKNRRESCKRIHAILHGSRHGAWAWNEWRRELQLRRAERDRAVEANGENAGRTDLRPLQEWHAGRTATGLSISEGPDIQGQWKRRGPG